MNILAYGVAVTPTYDARVNNDKCSLVTRELEKQKLQGNPQSEVELFKRGHEITRIGLREGVFPSALLMMYTMNHSKKQ
jgi:hypothetical protein